MPKLKISKTPLIGQHSWKEHFNEDIADHRFIPYIQLHEFEALVFADPDKLELEYPEYKAQIKTMIRQTKGKKPEEINDDPNTAPSKRIMQAISKFRKRYATSRVLAMIGLEVIREKCPHFDDWLSKLEAL